MKKTTFLAASLLTILAGCSNELENDALNQQGSAIEFKMGVSSTTRTITNDKYETDFAAEDQVGIFAEDGANVTPGYYKYNGSAWESQGSPLYANPTIGYCYYGYYPYNSANSDYKNIALSVEANQTQGFNASDALIAQNKAAAPGATEIGLKYSHAFALIQVNLSGEYAKADATVTLKDVITDATADLTTGQVTTGTGKSDVKMWAHTQNATTAEGKYIFRAIVPAQEIAAETPLLTISSNGKTYSFKWSTNVAYKKGELRPINVTIGEKTAISFPAGDTSIENWGNSESIGGNGSEVETPAEPVDRLELPLAESTGFRACGNWASDKQTGPENFWFLRNNKDPETKITVDGNALTIISNIGKKGSWNNSCIGYHHYGLFEQTIYKVTIVASGASGSILGCTFSNSTDEKMFKMFNDKGADWKRNVTTLNKLDAAAEVTKVLYIDLNKASTTGSSNFKDYDEATTYTATTEADVNKGINIMLYNYTDANSTAETNVVVKSVIIEKAELPTVQ